MMRSFSKLMKSTYGLDRVNLKFIVLLIYLIAFIEMYRGVQVLIDVIA